MERPLFALSSGWQSPLAAAWWLAGGGRRGPGDMPGPLPSELYAAHTATLMMIRTRPARRPWSPVLGDRGVADRGGRDDVAPGDRAAVRGRRGAAIIGRTGDGRARVPSRCRRRDVATGGSHYAIRSSGKRMSESARTTAQPLLSIGGAFGLAGRGGGVPAALYVGEAE
jgi:hypothetical protein